jgi:tetratricopeptide (TPR) repeat protein
MSLLMDALKKAEEAKRRAEAAAKREPPKEKARTGGAAPAASAQSGTNARGLPELPPSLELLDHEFPAPAASAATEHSRPATERDPQHRERAAAQNLFEAKHPARSRSFPVMVGLATLIAAAGIGAYLWWEMQPKGGVALAPVGARQSASPQTTPIVPIPSVGPGAAPAPAPPGLPADATPQVAASVPAARPQAAPASTRAAAPAADLAVERRTSPEAASPIRISTARLQVNPAVARGYQAYSAGDLAAARNEYERVLKGERKNTEALHGLAAISLRQGQFGEAEAFYLRVLEADPKDAAAQAALIGLRGQVDPLQSESRLKSLLGSQPDSPFLHFALGNVYAGQVRWNEAQQAYFRAFAGDGENPDYQFNLAVSLEQLRQPKLALQYYQGALAAAATRSASFDKNIAAGRVRELSADKP